MDLKCPPGKRTRSCTAATLLLSAVIPGVSQEMAANSSLLELKELSLEELVDQEVTILSRRPERVAGVPSAVEVLSGEQIRRSGVVTIPDALRLGTGLHVAQSDGHTWAISARGFNAASAQTPYVTYYEPTTVYYSAPTSYSYSAATAYSSSVV